MKISKLSLSAISIALCILSCSNVTPNAKYDGIDVSHHQGKIDWNTVGKNKQIQFVYIKATEGATYTDPRFKENFDGAKAAGLRVGAFHYFRTTSSVQDQFENFKKHCPKGSLDLIPMIDVENCGKWKPSEVKKAVKELSDLFEEYYGKKPIIYSVNKQYNSYLAPTFNGYTLYIGRYNNKTTPPIIPGKEHYAIWQYTDKGRVKGIHRNVDLCIFHKDNGIEDLLLSD